LAGQQAERGSSLTEALIATADRRLWARYCRLAAALEDDGKAPAVHAVGSLEWQRQQDGEPPAAGQPLSAEEEAAGRRRLAQRGAASAFAGAPSPLGPAGSAAFEEFLARRRGPPELAGEIDAVEPELIAGLEAAGRAGHWRARGFAGGGEKEIEPDWFGRMRLDFAQNRVVLPDGSEIADIAMTAVEPGDEAAGGGARERRARAMLRKALTALWERGAFTAGTGNERVLALVLRELGLSPSDPPYGFKSAETVRKLRKALGMSL
jgi:hypothetical protein